MQRFKSNQQLREAKNALRTAKEEAKVAERAAIKSPHQERCEDMLSTVRPIWEEFSWKRDLLLGQVTCVSQNRGLRLTADTRGGSRFDWLLNIRYLFILMPTWGGEFILSIPTGWRGNAEDLAQVLADELGVPVTVKKGPSLIQRATPLEVALKEIISISGRAG